MGLLTLAEIDRELASWTAQVADLSMALVELDNHPGLEHLRRYSPTGVTAQRWAALEPALGHLWDELASVTSILESAQPRRGRRSKLDDDDLAELSRMCGGAELSAGFDRTRAAYRNIKEFFDAVEQINTTVANQLGPSLKQIDAAGTTVPKDVTDLLAVSASDPLCLTTDEIERRIGAINGFVALQANWPDAIADTSIRLDALRDAVRQAEQTRERATQMVLSGPLPVSTDCEPALRAELESITAPDPAGLIELRRRIESALQRVRQDEALAQGLLDRRTELEGRLRAYHAKVTRLGLTEDPDLLSSQRIAIGRLARRPCDLRAVTHAIVDYQQMVSAKQEKTR
jgi:hypothetical protein